MLVTTEELHAKPGREEELAELLSELARSWRGEAGCIEVRLTRSAHDGRLFLLLARYTDRAALDAHARAAHYTAALPALMDCLETPPEVAIFEELAGAAG